MNVRQVKLKSKLIVIASIICSIIFCANTIKAQEKPRIANISNKVAEDGNKIIITYDILNSVEGQTFNIWIDVKTPGGVRLNAHSFTGNVGNNISGGTGKLVVWNKAADNIPTDAEFYIKVNGLPENTKINNNKVNKKIEEKDNKKDEIVEIKNEEDINPIFDTEVKSNSTKGKALLLSAVVPGLGIYSLDKSKPYWLMGVLGYGCIAASIYYNQQAVANYDDYLETYDMPKRNALFSDSKSQNNISKVCAISAASIWVGSMIWTLIKAGKTDDAAVLNFKKSRVFLGYGYNQLVKAPELMVRIQF